MKTLLILAGYPRTATRSLANSYRNNPIRFLNNKKENYILTEKLKSIDDYILDYRNLSEQYPECIPADFTTTNMRLSEETLIELKEKAKPYFNIKVLLSLRHPVERIVSLFYKNLEWRYQERPYDMDPKHYDVEWIQHEIPYLTTYNKFKKYFPILAIDGIHYQNTFYRKKELSELIEYDLPEVKSVHNNTSLHTGEMNKLEERKLYKLYSEDIETWKRLCY